ncbi:MAG TPA: amidohydrolase family protein [Rhizobiaceae bacterium]|nr:amidohydrolase family protein [Rhizobiaceae bacterium]
MRQRIDAHHHLWKFGHFPYAWLAPASPPRPFGDHSKLKTDYLVADYARDMADAGVVASVFVEANAGAPGAAEIDWVDKVGGDDSLPAVAVGYADLRRSDISLVLSAFQRSSRMRGIRMSLAWDERPQWRFIGSPDVIHEREFQRGLAELTRRDMTFDILVVPGQLKQLAALARINPDQQIIINHLGTPLRETPEDMDEWAGGMRECAKCRNISVKLSGLWVLDRGWAPERIGGPVRMVVDLFGPDRCMWATNYPVEKLMCPVGDQIRNLEAVLDHLSEDDMDQVFRRTAARIYDIPLIGEAAAVVATQAMPD